MRGRVTDILLIVLAVLVPLAGLVLTVQQAAAGQRDVAVRVGTATLVGVALYALLFL